MNDDWYDEVHQRMAFFASHLPYQIVSLWYVLLAKITKKLMMTCTSCGKETERLQRQLHGCCTLHQKDVLLLFVAFYQTIYCTIRKRVYMCPIVIYCYILLELLVMTFLVQI